MVKQQQRQQEEKKITTVNLGINFNRSMEKEMETIHQNG